MKVSDPEAAYGCDDLQALKSQLIASIDASCDVAKLKQCLEFMNHTVHDAPCLFTDEEFEEELRLSEDSGFVSHEEALKMFTQWGFVR